MKPSKKSIAKTPRNSPIGKIAVLQSEISAECWNFTCGTKWKLHHGQRIRVCRVYDSFCFTCEAVNEAGECVGIELEPGNLGYRFIISNSDLRKACPDLRPVPRKNFDLVGEIIKAES